MLGSAVRGFIERRAISTQTPTVAAWFLGMTDGRVLFVVNTMGGDTPGWAHYVESWFRLNALVRIRPFGVLLAAEVAQGAPVLDTHTHVPL